MQKRNFLGFQKYYNIEGDIELDVNFTLRIMSNSNQDMTQV